MSEDDEKFERDYTTARRRNEDGRLVYGYGESRVTSSMTRVGQVSPVGKLHNTEVFGAQNPKFPLGQDNRLFKKLIDEGVYKLPEGVHFNYEWDENGRWQAEDGKWYTENSEVVPGDLIEIIDHPDDLAMGFTATVKRVIFESSATISAIITDSQGPQGVKYRLTRGQYRVISRPMFKSIPDNDYLSHGTDRKDIIDEDRD